MLNQTFKGTTQGITQATLGLDEADNTSDSAKPGSTRTPTDSKMKAPFHGPTFEGTVSGLTQAMVGLSDVDSMSDLNKPVSNSTQTE